MAKNTITEYTRRAMHISKTLLKAKMVMARIGQNFLGPQHYLNPVTVSAGVAT